MGMGEPLLNIPSVMMAQDFINKVYLPPCAAFMIEPYVHNTVGGTSNLGKYMSFPYSICYFVVPQTLNIGARHITISTVGVPNALSKLAQYSTQCTLAISLHAPTQEARESIVPRLYLFPVHSQLKCSVFQFPDDHACTSHQYIL